MLLPFYLYIAISTSEGVATTQTLDVEASSTAACQAMADYIHKPLKDEWYHSSVICIPKATK